MADMPGPAASEPALSPDQAGPDQAGPIALYRRYRPATFAGLRGQDHVTEPLRQALRSGRIHHAYLFSGPRGCGKTSSARILARSLNCEQGPTPDPCGVCASCVALAPSGPGSIDVIEIDAASHGGVDDARDLRERAFYAPVAGRFKIYIVDEAHMVTREGFNALLKLVEEPPPHLKFVFATTEPEKVIATIRSRTHHYPFRLMPPAVLRGLLEEILAAEGVQYEVTVLPVVIRAGAGSARDTLSVLDQLIAGSDEKGLTYDHAVALLGYTDDSLLDEVTDAFAASDGAAVFHAVDRLIEAGHDPRRFAADLLDRLRDLIVLAAVPDAGQTGLLDAPADRLDRMGQQAATMGAARLTRAAEVISAGLIEMRGVTSPRLLLELMCAQVLLPAPDVREQELQARLERLEQRIGTGTPQDLAPRITPADTAPPASSGKSRVTEDAAQPAPEGAAVPRPGSRPSTARRDAGVDAPGGSPGGSDAENPDPGNRAGRPAGRTTGAAAPQPRDGGGPGSAGDGADPGRSGRAAAGPRAGGAGASGGDGRTGHAGGTRPAGQTQGHDQAAPAGAGGAPGAGQDAVTERWDAILDGVMAERKVSWILLRSARVESFQDGVLTLSFPREGDARGFTAGGHDRSLSAVLERTLGITPQIKAIFGPPGGAPTPAAARRTPVAPAPGGADSGGPSSGGASAGGAAPGGPAAGGSASSGSGSGSSASGGHVSGAGTGQTEGRNSGRADAETAPGNRPASAAVAGDDFAGLPPDDDDDEPGPARNGARTNGAARPSQQGQSSGAAQARAAATRSKSAGGRATATASPSPSASSGVADDDADLDEEALTGADLIERELGGRLIEENGAS
jgi:DNA polymerase-3 subunit gamma/tau